MIEQHLRLIAELEFLLKSKDDSLQTLSIQAMHKFEFALFETLNIVRFELQSFGEITDRTADDLSQLFAFQTFEFYMRDYPLLYKKCSEVSSAFSSYNEKYRNHILPGKIGVWDNQWRRYLAATIERLINTVEPILIKSK